MACCAIAAFILSQIYLLVVGAKELLFGKSTAIPSVVTTGAAAWRLDAPMEAVAAPASRGWVPTLSTPRLTAIATLTFAGVAIAAAATRTPEIIAFIKYSANICGL